MKNVMNALHEVREYFDNRADADCDQDGFIPNEEMRLLSLVDEAIAEADRADKFRLVMRTALHGLNDHIEKMQAIMARHIEPFGYSEREVISKLIYALDGPEQRRVQDSARDVIAKAGQP